MSLDSTKKAHQTLEEALLAHLAWKATLRAAVESREDLDVANLRCDRCCDLGKWLHSEGRSQFGHQPEFLALVEKHRDFHQIASVVAGMIHEEDTEQALSMLTHNSPFARASTDVALAIMRLKSVVSMPIA